MAFILKKPEPFVVEGEKGNYMIPAMSSLNASDLGDILTMTPDTPAAEKITIIKAFLLRMCPEIEQEELGDWGYFQIYQAYEKEQNPGK